MQIMNGCSRGTIARSSLRAHEFKGILVGGSQQELYAHVNSHRKSTKCCQVSMTKGTSRLTQLKGQEDMREGRDDEKVDL